MGQPLLQVLLPCRLQLVFSRPLDPEVQKLSRGNRFRLMFGLSILPDTDMSDEKKKKPDPNLSQAKTKERIGTYCGPVEALKGATATTRPAYLQEAVVIAKFHNTKLRVFGKDIGPNWHPLLAADFNFNDAKPEPTQED